MPNSCRSKPQLLTPFFFGCALQKKGMGGGGGGVRHCWEFCRGGTDNAGPCWALGSLICPLFTCVAFSQCRHSRLCIGGPALLCSAPVSHSEGESVFDFVRQKGSLSHTGRSPEDSIGSHSANPKFLSLLDAAWGQDIETVFFFLFFHPPLPLIFLFFYFSPFCFLLFVSLSHLLPGVSKDTAIGLGFEGKLLGGIQWEKVLELQMAGPHVT